MRRRPLRKRWPGVMVETTDKKIKGYKLHPSIYIEAKDMWIDA